MKYWLLSLALLIFASCSHSQGVDQRNLDSLFQFYDKNELFFVNGLLKRDDKIIYQQSAGYQNVEDKIKNSRDTRFLIGSITKTYTAAIVLQLIEEGKLKMDDKLSDFYPQIPNAELITIEMLLRHRSGLFNYTNAPEFLQEVVNPISKEEFLERFKTLKIDFEPNSTFQYSNTNYILLGAIIESVSGSTYADQLKLRIIDKLSLKSTTLGRSVDEKTRATSYVFRNNAWEPTSPEWNTDWAWAAGGISATAEDVALFFEGLFNGKLISSKSLEMMTNIKDGYGLGLITVPYFNQRFFAHTGGIESFNSIAGYNPEDRTVLVRLINGSKHFDGNDISVQLLNGVYNRDIIFPDLTPKIGVDVPMTVLKNYEGEYTAEGFPLAIRVFVNGNQLFGQVTGQGAFPLNALSNSEFVFNAASIKMIFFENEGKTGFHFQQAAMKFDFYKK